MVSIRSVALAAVVLTAVPSSAVAQSSTPASGTGGAAQADAQSIRLGAVIFYDYTYTKAPKTTDAAGNRISPNAFNVARTYLNVTGTVSHLVSFRITPDITRESGSAGSTNGSLVFRLKYGYVQLSLDDWLWRGSYARLGIQQTPFIDSQEGVYRYRFQGTTFAERDGGLSSSDAGATFRTAFPNSYGDVHVGVYNGEGYSKAEANDQKSFQFRATVRPMPAGNPVAKGLRGTFFVNRDHAVQGAERNRMIVAALFEHSLLNAGFDYLRGTDRSLPTSPSTDVEGYSFFVTPFFDEKGNGLEALLRFDSYKPDRDLDGRRSRLILGGAYWFPHPGGSATAAILLDYEQVTFKNFATPQARQQRIAVHGLINF